MKSFWLNTIGVLTGTVLSVVIFAGLLQADARLTRQQRQTVAEAVAKNQDRMEKEMRVYGALRYRQGFEEAKAKYLQPEAPAADKTTDSPPKPAIKTVAHQVTQPAPKPRFTVADPAPARTRHAAPTPTPRYTTQQLIDYSRSLTPQRQQVQSSSGRGRGLFRRFIR